MGFWSNIQQGALNALFPRRCPMCGTVLMPNERICGTCSDSLVYIQPPVCRICGRPSFECDCGGVPRCFDRCVSPFVYTKSVRKGLHRLKFHNAPDSAVFFGRFMAATVRREFASYSIDVVTCVPMHREDQNKRGYNQAALLATSVGQSLELPVYNNILAKPYITNVQHTLSRTDRERNIRGAITVARPAYIRRSTVLLCDDIITTGSTLNECARVMLDAGADSVLCVTAAAVVGSSQGNVKRMYVS